MALDGPIPFSSSNCSAVAVLRFSKPAADGGEADAAGTDSGAGDAAPDGNVGTEADAVPDDDASAAADAGGDPSPAAAPDDAEAAGAGFAAG